MDWFKGTSNIQRPKLPIDIRSIDRASMFGPEHYEADAGLRDAVNVALALDQALLLTGEPGTGKTQLAERLALELGIEPLFKFETKSTSVAQDLFYTFDTIGRFHAGQMKRSDEDMMPLRFIQYGALGRAILQGMKADKARRFFADGQLPDWFRGDQRAVVLIDEIDKAPRDFPNDVLNEIERHYFRIRELEDMDVQAETQRAPIVIITSNSEKQLPDAFLRRCVYYHLPPMDRERLERIVQRRIGTLGPTSGPLLQSALDFYFDLRGETYNLRKKPSTAEFIAWVSTLLRRGALPNEAIDGRRVMESLSVLVKSPEDQEVVKAHPLLRAVAKSQ